MRAEPAQTREPPRDALPLLRALASMLAAGLLFGTLAAAMAGRLEAGSDGGPSGPSARIATAPIGPREQPPGLSAGPDPRNTTRPVLQALTTGPASWPVFLAASCAALMLLVAWLLWRMRRDRRDLEALRAEAAQREAADAERRKTEAFHRAYYDNTTDSLFVLRVEAGGFTLADRNLAHRQAFGMASHDVIGKELHEIVPPEMAGRLTAFFRRCVEENRPVRFEVDFGPEFAERRWETVLAPIHDPSGAVTHIMGASRDVTDRLELEERLRQGQKMEAIGQLTGGIAHDFNNLLTVVMGNLDQLKRAREDRKPKLIHNAMQAVDRARELSQKLLAFGRRQSLTPEPTVLKALIAGMDDMLMQSLRGDIRLELELPDGLWPVEVDHAQFQVALINLAANARDAMPRGGTLRVSAANTLVRGGEPFEGVVISVADTGHGMAPEVAARAFDPFFTTKEVGKGTGLGLSQVRGFAQGSGGSVEIRSEAGAGTTVTLYLPRAQARSRPAEAQSPEAGGDLRALHILVVEDNVQVAEVAAAILREQGHTVTTASGADEALAALEATPGIEFVFSDLVMPGERNGLDLARVIRRRWPTLPVLLATGYSEAGARATQEGFTLLPKPYRAGTLVATIKRVWVDAKRGLDGPEGAARNARAPERPRDGPAGP